MTVAVIKTTGTSYRQLFESIAAQATDPASAYVDFFAGAGVVLAQSGYLDPCPIGSLAREVAHTREPLRLAAAAVFVSWIEAATGHLVEAGVPGQRATELATCFVATLEGTFVLSRTLRSTAPLISAGALVGHLVAQALQEGARVGA